MAIGDAKTKLAEPWQVLSSSKFKVQSSRLMKESNIEKVVIGVTGGRIDGEIKKFGETLKKQDGVEVEFFDETLTTQDAQRILLASGRKRKSRQEKEDAIAAAIMLESYLDRLR